METLALIAARMEAANIAYTVETEGVEQEDWQNGWRKYYHPWKSANVWRWCPRGSSTTPTG